MISHHFTYYLKISLWVLWDRAIMRKVFTLIVPRRILNIQCLRSSLTQDGWANYSKKSKQPSNCGCRLRKAHLLPKIFEIELRPIWWVAGTEQPLPRSSQLIWIFRWKFTSPFWLRIDRRHCCTFCSRWPLVLGIWLWWKPDMQTYT